MNLKIGDTVRINPEIKKRHNIGKITGIARGARCDTGVLVKVSCYPKWIDSGWVKVVE